MKIIKESITQIRQGLASQMWCSGELRNMDGHTKLWMWIDATVAHLFPKPPAEVIIKLPINYKLE